MGQKKNGKTVQEPVKSQKQQPKHNDGVFVDESENENHMEPEEGFDLFGEMLYEQKPDPEMEVNNNQMTQKV